MPSILHELIVDMVRRCPDLVAQLLDEALGVPVPGHTHADVAAADLTELVPTELRADRVVTFTSAAAKGGRPALAVVVEVQLSKDSRKRWSWPAYLTTLRARLRCPVALLVICPDAAVAAWAARPIVIVPGGPRFVPLVAGPYVIPVITDPVEASRVLELTVLSVLAHRTSPKVRAMLEALVEAVATADPDGEPLYLGIVHGLLPAAAREHLEDLMETRTEPAMNSLQQAFFDKGARRASAAAILSVLAARRLEISEPARSRIEASRDLAQLETWVERAATVATVDELFA